MILEFVLIVLCLLLWLPIVYMLLSIKTTLQTTNNIKNDDDYDDDDDDDDYDAVMYAYKRATRDIEAGFVRFEKEIENQRKIVNGWQHKIDIMDRDIRKLKKELLDNKDKE